MMGKEYWSDLFKWIKNKVLLENNNISEKDLELFIVVDEPEEAVKHIDDFYKKYSLAPNF